MDIKAAVKRMETQRQELLKEIQGSFGSMVQEITKAHPVLKAFSWTQYTPYFCDGDPCVFGASTDDLSFHFDGFKREKCPAVKPSKEGVLRCVNNAEHTGPCLFQKVDPADADNIDYIDWNEEEGEGNAVAGYELDMKGAKFPAEYAAAVAAVDAFIGEIPQEFLKDMFGDHVRVIVHADGRTETQEYDHD